MNEQEMRRDAAEMAASRELNKNGASEKFYELARNYHRLAGEIGYRKGV